MRRDVRSSAGGLRVWRGLSLLLLALLFCGALCRSRLHLWRIQPRDLCVSFLGHDCWRFLVLYDQRIVLVAPREVGLLERDARAVELLDVDPLEILLVGGAHDDLVGVEIDGDRISRLWRVRGEQGEGKRQGKRREQRDG